MDDATDGSTRVVEVPSNGEIARLTASASARAKEDAAEAIVVTTATNATTPFESVDDVIARLMPFHAFAGPEDAGLDEGTTETTPERTRRGKTGEEGEEKSEVEASTSSRGDRGGDAEGRRLGREASWRRDAEAFAKDAAALGKRARAKLSSRRRSTDASTDALDIDERALIERLAWDHARSHLRLEQAHRSLAVHRFVKLEADVRSRELQLRAYERPRHAQGTDSGVCTER